MEASAYFTWLLAVNFFLYSVLWCAMLVDSSKKIANSEDEEYIENDMNISENDSSTKSAHTHLIVLLSRLFNDENFCSIHCCLHFFCRYLVNFDTSFILLIYIGELFDERRELLSILFLFLWEKRRENAKFFLSQRELRLIGSAFPIFISQQYRFSVLFSKGRESIHAAHKKKFPRSRISVRKMSSNGKHFHFSVALHWRFLKDFLLNLKFYWINSVVREE